MGSNLRKKQDRVFQKLEGLKRNLNVQTFSYRGRMEQDSRLCLTIVYLLPKTLGKKLIKDFITPLRKLDSRQYYLTEESLHLTIQNVKAIMDSRKCRKEKFRRSDILKVMDLDDFFRGRGEMRFELDGLFRMPESIGLRCYPDKKTSELILALRQKLIEIGVPDDKVYLDPHTVIGNITLCRFYSRPTKEFLEGFDRLRHLRLGSLKIRRIYLITTNFVCSPGRTKIRKIFPLGGS